MADIGRELITTYRKQLWSPFTKAVREYGLIEAGDRIAVCVSGGKDSFLLAALLRQLQAYGPVPFELKYLCLDPGYAEADRAKIRENAAKLGIGLEYVPAVIFRYLETLGGKPCYLCARMRRGHLYQAAKDRGCNKIALGHHYDDVVETILLSILYAGKLKTMLPRLPSRNFMGMSLIRPLYLVGEEAISAFWADQGYAFIRCACSLTAKRDLPGSEEYSKRAEVKRLIREGMAKNPNLKANLFASAREVCVETLLSYRDERGLHNNWERSAEEAPGEAEQGERD